MEWHVFAGEYYYPRGGVNDYRGSYATFEEAADRCKAPRERYEWEDDEDYSTAPAYEWAHVAHANPDGTLTLYWVRGN